MASPLLRSDDLLVPAYDCVRALEFPLNGVSPMLKFSAPDGPSTFSAAVFLESPFLPLRDLHPSVQTVELTRGPRFWSEEEPDPFPFTLSSLVFPPLLFLVARGVSSDPASLI